MPVTNTPPDDLTQEGYDQLHYLVTHLVKAAFVGEVWLITTDRTGKVDAAWGLPASGKGQPVRRELHSWLQTASDKTRDFTLLNLGGMLQMYVAHPLRNPLVGVRTYDDWPAMVEVNLYE